MSRTVKTPTVFYINELCKDIYRSDNPANRIENGLSYDYSYFSADDKNVRKIIDEIKDIYDSMLETALKSYLYGKYGHTMPESKLKDWKIDGDNISDVLTDYDGNYNEMQFARPAYYEKSHIFDAVVTAQEKAVELVRLEYERQAELHENHSEHVDGCMECEAEYIEDVREKASFDLDYRNSVL